MDCGGTQTFSHSRTADIFQGHTAFYSLLLMLAVFVLSLHICQFGSLYMTIDTDDLIVQLFFVISHCHKSSFTKIPNKNRSDAFNLRPLRNPPPCLKLSFCFSDLGDPMPRRLTLGPDCHHQNAQESIWKKGCRPAETVTEKQ